MATLPAEPLKVPGVPRWIATYTATLSPTSHADARAGRATVGVKLVVHHPRALLLWGLLTGRVRPSRREG